MLQNYGKKTAQGGLFIVKAVKTRLLPYIGHVYAIKNERRPCSLMTCERAFLKKKFFYLILIFLLMTESFVIIR